MEPKIAVSVLGADLTNIRKSLDTIKSSGADMIHFDVMDGHFVPNISFGIPVLKAMKSCCDMFYDVHLMIDDPLKYAKSFAKAGADLITFHIESQSDPEKTIEEIKSSGAKAGISLKPATHVKDIIPFLDKVDLVLVMTVEPGFGGQKFMDYIMPKVEFLRSYRAEKGLNYKIEVDGGINADTYKKAVESGSDILVSGSYLTNSKNMAESVAKLKS